MKDHLTCILIPGRVNHTFKRLSASAVGRTEGGGRVWILGVDETHHLRFKDLETGCGAFIGFHSSVDRFVVQEAFPPNEVDLLNSLQPLQVKPQQDVSTDVPAQVKSRRIVLKE